MNIAEVQVFDTEGNNVSAGKQVSMSSFYTANNSFPGKNLVDGNLNNFAHTSCSDKGWMKIDLESTVAIARITVYNRVDCCKDRLRGTTVQVLDASGSPVYTSPGLTNAGKQDLYPRQTHLTTAAASGLVFRIFVGYFNDDVSFFSRAQQVETGTTFDTTNLTSGVNGIIVAQANQRHYFSVMWTGYFKARVSGKHTFWISSDDASYVWLGDNAATSYTVANAFIKDGSLHGMQEKSNSIDLKAGQMYPIRIAFGENGGGYDCQFTFQEPGGNRSGNGQGYYFHYSSG